MIVGVRVVVCDIDGTLVAKHKNLSVRAKKAIEIMREHGILFGIASGRPFDELGIMHGWGVPFDLIIGMNGCKLKDNIHDKTYSYFPMKKEWIKDAMEIMAPFDTNPFVAMSGYSLVHHYDELCELSKQYTGKPMIVANDPSELYAQDNDKILFRINEKDMPEIEAYIKKHPHEYIRGFKTGPLMIEFANKNANKGYALKKYCEINDIDIQDVWAFGDTTNDNEMLEVAGLGVCMCDGSDDTKACADVLTDKPCTEDGFADFIEKHLLIPNGWL